MGKPKEKYVAEYLAAAKRLSIDIEQPTHVITKTAELACDVDSYLLEPGDEPSEKSPSRGQ